LRCTYRCLRSGHAIPPSPNNEQALNPTIFFNVGFVQGYSETYVEELNLTAYGLIRNKSLEQRLRGGHKNELSGKEGRERNINIILEYVG